MTRCCIGVTALAAFDVFWAKETVATSAQIAGRINRKLLPEFQTIFHFLCCRTTYDKSSLPSQLFQVNTPHFDEVIPVLLYRRRNRSWLSRHVHKSNAAESVTLHDVTDRFLRSLIAGIKRRTQAADLLYSLSSSDPYSTEDERQRSRKERVWR